MKKKNNIIENNKTGGRGRHALPCPVFAPAEVKAVWSQWTFAMREAWIVANQPKYTSKLLRPKSESLVPVREDIFVHDAKVIADVREALEQGLKPVTFSLIGDSVVLRLEREES